MPPAVIKKHPGSDHGGGSVHGRRRRRGGASAAHGNEGSERWLVTYADMLTLLLVLFIVLYAISSVNGSKFIALRNSLSIVFGDGTNGLLPGGPAVNDADAQQMGAMPGAPIAAVSNPASPGELGPGSPTKAGESTPSSSPAAPPTARPTIPSAAGPSVAPIVPIPTSAAPPTPTDLPAAIATELDNFRRIEAAINASLGQAGMSGAVQFSIDRRGLIITVVTDALVFPGNSATLLPRGEKLLAVITPPLTTVTNNVEVDGYTNQENVSTYPYPSGWELSSARASTVVRYLQGHGLATRQLSAVGFSDQRPLVPPDDPRSITRNRRVEIVVLTSLPASAGDALAAAGAAQAAGTP